MNRRFAHVFGFAALGLAGAAMGVPVADPVYTFCEEEDNDLCVDSQIIDADVAVSATGDEFVRDCFFITGKLQADCVWDIEPKCALRAYGKPLQCYDSNRNPIPGQFYEPLIASSDAQGRILNLAPLPGDRTIRLAVATIFDALDGTVNGLNQNNPHNEQGEVTIKLVYDGDDDDGPFRGDEPDDSYVFKFSPSVQLALGEFRGGKGGPMPPEFEFIITASDAARVAFVIPPGVTSVDVYCCDDTGTQEICYDLDFYTVTSLIPNRNYCVTVVGGLDEQCFKGQFALGWFDKQWQQLPGVSFGELAELCVLSDGEGDLRFAVSGGGDSTMDFDFNGLYDPLQQDYFFYLFLINALTGSSYEFRAGASTKDASIDAVNRYPRALWDDERFTQFFVTDSSGFRFAPENFAAHWECAEYCIKVRLAEHVDPSERPTTQMVMGPERADINLDETVNAADLALLLSFWGPVPAQ